MPRPAARGEAEAHELGALVVLADMLADQAQKGPIHMQRSMIVHHDGSITGGWQTAVQTAQTEFSRVDVLVNNAGICVNQPSLSTAARAPGGCLWWSGDSHCQIRVVHYSSPRHDHDHRLSAEGFGCVSGDGRQA